MADEPDLTVEPPSSRGHAPSPMSAEELVGRRHSMPDVDPAALRADLDKAVDSTL